MREGQVRITKSSLRVIHARSIDAEGRIVPRCSRAKTRRAVEDLIVSGNVARVDCERCKEHTQ